MESIFQNQTGKDGHAQRALSPNLRRTLVCRGSPTMIAGYERPFESRRV